MGDSKEMLQPSTINGQSRGGGRTSPKRGGGRGRGRRTSESRNLDPKTDSSHNNRKKPCDTRPENETVRTESQNGRGRGGRGIKDPIRGGRGRSSTRGRGGGGRRGNAGSRNKSQMTDDEILIAFTPLLRSKDPEAQAIHDRYMKDAGTSRENQSLFVEAARKLLLERLERTTSVDKESDKHEESTPNESDDDQAADLDNIFDDPSTKPTSAKCFPTDHEADEAIKLSAQSRDENSVIDNMETSGAAEKHELVDNTEDEQELIKATEEARLSLLAMLQQSNSADSPEPVKEPEQVERITTRQAVVTKPLPPHNPPGLSHTRQAQPTISSPVPQNQPDASEQNLQSNLAQQKKQNDSGRQKQKLPTAAPAVANTAHLPKRIMRNQPGKIVANRVMLPQSLVVRPKQEIVAQWYLPLQYILSLIDKLNKDSQPKQHTIESLQQDIVDLVKLKIGLFRVGAETNFSVHTKQNTSIISKDVTTFTLMKAPTEQEGATLQYLQGQISFYAPRTPGNVILRLYSEAAPIYTFATGPYMNVHVTTWSDLDATLRFVLSCFKSQANQRDPPTKGDDRRRPNSRGAPVEKPSPLESTSRSNGTSTSTLSLGGLFNLGLVLNSWCTTGFALASAAGTSSSTGVGSSQQNNHGQNNRQGGRGTINSAEHDLEHDAGRALWGCLCEARKVMEATRDELTPKLEKLNSNLQELEHEYRDSKEKDFVSDDDAEELSDNDAADAQDEVEEKKQKLIKKLVNLRKERAATENKLRDAQTAYFYVLQTLTTNEDVMKHLLRTEQLVKLRNEYELWCPICESSAALPKSSSSLAPYIKAKIEMQQQRMKFIPADNVTLEHVLVQGGERAAGVLQSLATAMQHMYVTQIRPSDEFYISREQIRAQVENIVKTKCQAHFPPETRVMVFGSSANGFGSSTSDLDMCLQLPDVSESEGWFATKGREAMAFLAKELEANGMTNVNAERLTARIPVIMFQSTIEVGGDNILVECDISMRNPLAVLNTQFLRTYASMDVRIVILASMIKKWAKARNINDPSRHTLSSYGYLLMLLHFLLLRRQQGMCLPNLLFTDPSWKSGEVYHELPTRPELPQLLLRHPNEEDYNVNAYFYSPRDEETFRCLQRIVTSGGTASGASGEVGLLLAKFFRYYAFEFDYRQHIISLHSGAQRSGYVKKEVKGELDGWKTGNTPSLAIEDPFEQFYNVGHVVNPSQFQRIRKEFALAYTKIVGSCLGNGKQIRTGDELIDLICEPEE